MTCQPFWNSVSGINWGNTGVLHRAIAVLEFDPVTGMRQKSPPAWAGIWTGLNVLQLLKCENAFGERAFILSRNATGGIEIWEISKSDINDTNSEGANPIEWFFESKSYNYNSSFGLKRLDSGDLFVDNIVGSVDYEVWYRPDQYPSWIDWTSWNICTNDQSCGLTLACPVPTLAQPQYRTKMRLPTPSDSCNQSLGVNFRNMYETQVRVSITGYCRVRSVRVHAYDVTEPVVGECLPSQGECVAVTSCDLSPFTYSSE
jgi:hypothetical protein